MFMLLSRWLGWRLDFLVMLFVTFTVLFGLLVGRTLDAALVSRFSCAPWVCDKLLYSLQMGMAVSYTLQLSGSFQWMVRQSAEVENQMVSAERCFEYSELPVRLQEWCFGSSECTNPWPRCRSRTFSWIEACDPNDTVALPLSTLCLSRPSTGSPRNCALWSRCQAHGPQREKLNFGICGCDTAQIWSPC